MAMKRAFNVLKTFLLLLKDSKCFSCKHYCVIPDDVIRRYVFPLLENKAQLQRKETFRNTLPDIARCFNCLRHRTCITQMTKHISSQLGF